MTDERQIARCAIYTRKSSDQGANDYTSLQHQREASEAYIISQSSKGWIALPERYDDGGYSGATMRRPALEALLTNVSAGRIDIVVVYKIDRLTRSLRDFAKLVDVFEQAGAAIVAVTQAFDTSSSMGRLTLNVLLSFAQFERELTGERQRDWRAGARARGQWTTERPYGYAKDKGNRLVPHPDEAPIVRRIFERYCRLASCRLVADELFAGGIRNKSGRPWSGHMVLHTIKHRVYRGEMVHRGEGRAGSHEPIVSERLWQRAHRAYLGSKWHRRALVEPPVPAMLKGLVYDRTGHRLHHTFLHAKGRLYRYYIASAEGRRYGTASDAYMRFRAVDLEQSVLNVVNRLTGSSWETRNRQETTEHIRRHVDRIDIDLDEMRVSFRTGATVVACPGGRLGDRQARPKKGA